MQDSAEMQLHAQITACTHTEALCLWIVRWNYYPIIRLRHVPIPRHMGRQLPISTISTHVADLVAHISQHAMLCLCRVCEWPRLLYCPDCTTVLIVVRSMFKHFNVFVLSPPYLFYTFCLPSSSSCYLHFFSSAFLNKR